MTVKELKNELKCFDEEAELKIRLFDSRYKITEHRVDSLIYDKSIDDNKKVVVIIYEE